MVSDQECITLALQAAGIDHAMISRSDLSGGCIHRVSLIELDGGGKLVAKANKLEFEGTLREEVSSLLALGATGAVLVPVPLGVFVVGDMVVMLMNNLESTPAGEEVWGRLGEDLARMHRNEAGERYGYETDNHLGATLQPNCWEEDWVEFNARHRLGHQLKMARGRGRLVDPEADKVQAVIDRLEQLIPRHPQPSLLHGDLWSGNALATRDDKGQSRIAIIDPATYIGDGWADIAMMKLFGGFPESCFQAYTNIMEDQAQLETRIVVYQLYHVINHVNLFGRGYVGQAMALADQLLT